MKRLIAYSLPTESLPLPSVIESQEPDGVDTLTAGGIADYKGPWALYLAEHSGFTKGDSVYWFDPEEKKSHFTVISDIKVGELLDGGMAQVTFLLGTGIEANIDDLIKIIGPVPEGLPVQEWDEFDLTPETKVLVLNESGVAEEVVVTNTLVQVEA